jgi:ubiquinone/menaquinone biosynthesis C-methylase UbiE
MSVSGFAARFEQVLVPAIFRPWGIDLLDRIHTDSNERVLDVACGTGIIARLLRERGHAARLAGVDSNPGMIALARSLAPDIEWQEGNALQLPFADGSFDRVVCQQGLQFFPDRVLALREMRRVLADGGRVALSTWRPIEENPLFHALHTLAAARYGPHLDRRFCFGDATAIAALLTTAGLQEIRTEIVMRKERITDWRTFVAMNLEATIDALDEMSQEQRTREIETFCADAAEIFARFAEGMETVHPVIANVLTAHK